MLHVLRIMRAFISISGHVARAENRARIYQDIGFISDITREDAVMCTVTYNILLLAIVD